MTSNRLFGFRPKPKAEDYKKPTEDFSEFVFEMKESFPWNHCPDLKSAIDYLVMEHKELPLDRTEIYEVKELDANGIEEIWEYQYEIKTSFVRLKKADISTVKCHRCNLDVIEWYSWSNNKYCKTCDKNPLELHIQCKECQREIEV